MDFSAVDSVFKRLAARSHQYLRQQTCEGHDGTCVLIISPIMVKTSRTSANAAPSQPEHLAALAASLSDMKKKSKRPTSSDFRSSSAPKSLTKDQILCLSMKGAHASLAELKALTLAGPDAFMRMLNGCEEFVRAFKCKEGNVGRNAPPNGTFLFLQIYMFLFLQIYMQF